jgi:anti-sigma B factor antagonist
LIRNLDTRLVWRDRLAIVELNGEISDVAQEPLDRVYAQSQAGNPSCLLLDAKGVGYINSKGIALLVRLIGRAQQDGLQVAVSGLNEHFTEIFRITRLADYIDLYPSRETALQALQTPE